MSKFFTKLKVLTLFFTASTLVACSAVPPREAAMAAGVNSNDWKSRQVFSNNISFEHPVKRTRFSNALEMSLRNAGWFATTSASYDLSFVLLSEEIPKKFRVGSEGGLSIRYALKDKSNNILMSPH